MLAQLQSTLSMSLTTNISLDTNRSGMGLGPPLSGGIKPPAKISSKIVTPSRSKVDIASARLILSEAKITLMVGKVKGVLSRVWSANI